MLYRIVGSGFLLVQWPCTMHISTCYFPCLFFFSAIFHVLFSSWAFPCLTLKALLLFFSITSYHVVMREVQVAVHPTIGVHHVLVRRVFGPVHVVNALKSDYGSASQNMCFKEFLFLAVMHTSYLSFFLHEQNFWRIKFTPKNANFSR